MKGEGAGWDSVAGVVGVVVSFAVSFCGRRVQDVTIGERWIRAL